MTAGIQIERHHLAQTRGELERTTAELLQWHAAFGTSVASTAKRMSDSVIAEWDALRADLTALAEAIDTCLGGRGAYSCAPTHDCRCDKDRGISDECVCGADDLTAALNRPGVQAILNR